MSDHLLYNERELLSQLAGGSEDAFNTLFQRYRGKLYHYILDISGSREMAEDTVHDVFLKLWEDREKLTAIESLSSYIYRMCRNQAIDGLRRMAKETLIVAALKEESIPLISTIEPTRQKEIQQFIHKAIDKLSPRQRQIFILAKDQQLKHDDIAGELGISVNTVRTHLAEALRLLREEIGQQYGPLSVAIFVIYQVC